MPATDLISVDLPAPLSPTSAITSPSRTSKSTSVSAWTDPNDLETSRSSRVGGAPFPLTASSIRREAPRKDASRFVGFGRLLLAVLRVGPVTDLALLEEPVPEEQLVVLLRDPDRGQEDGRDVADLVVALAVHPGDLLTLDELGRHLRGRRGLLLHRLVHGAALPTGEDVLHPGRRRVLSRDRDRLQLVALEIGDHGAGQAVVRSDRAVDLVVVLREHLLEDRRTFLSVPVGPLVARLPFLEGAVLVERIEDRVVSVLEQRRVVVGDPAVQFDDHRMLLVFPVRLQRGDEAFAHRLADEDVVERDIVRRLAVEDETVVVNRLHALCFGGAFDRRTRG